MFRHTKYILTLIVLLLVLFSASCQMTTNQMAVFYYYDDLLNVRLENDFRGVENGTGKELFSIEDITIDYRSEVSDKLIALQSILDQNIELFNSAYLAFFQDRFYAVPTLFDSEERRIQYSTQYTYYQKLSQLLLGIISDFPSAVRASYNIEKYQYILKGRQIEDGVSATTAEWPENNLNYWSNYYFEKGDLLNPNGEIKLDHWFYETNLKYRIVVQIRSPDNRYLGEVAVDFYKFRNFNKLFSPEQVKAVQ